MPENPLRDAQPGDRYLAHFGGPPLELVIWTVLGEPYVLVDHGALCRLEDFPPTARWHAATYEKVTP